MIRWPISRELSHLAGTEDKDGDGTVSADELKDVLQHVNPKFTEAWERREDIWWHEQRRVILAFCGEFEIPLLFAFSFFQNNTIFHLLGFNMDVIWVCDGFCDFLWTWCIRQNPQASFGIIPRNYRHVGHARQDDGWDWREWWWCHWCLSGRTKKNDDQWTAHFRPSLEFYRFL